MRFPHILFAAVLFTFSFAEGKNNFNLKTIVIDAGHGGKDPGAIGSSKTYEKDVALAVALKLGSYIEKNFSDVKVVYTRKTDEFIELHQRAEVANKVKADLFIAIHCNSSPNTDFYGSSSYILGLHRTEANLEVAKRENAVILLEDNQDKNYEFNPNTPEGHIIMSMKQNAFLDQSIDFASKIENQLEVFAKRKSLGVKQAGFYVLYKTAMPSLLAEIGFISNPEEEKYLNSSHGQDQIASALYNAFRDYKSEMEGGEASPPVVKKEPDKEVEETPPSAEKEEAAEKEKPSSPLVDEPAKTVEETPAETKEADNASVTLKDGTVIKKPIETGGGGGKTVSAVPEPKKETVEIKEQPKPKPVEAAPKETIATVSKPAAAETKTVAPLKTETKASEPKPAPVKPETKVVEPVKQPDPKPVVASEVKSNRHPLVPLIQPEKGTVFMIQLFALKGELKEYDKFIRLFKVMTAEELSNGITRYYGVKVFTYAEAKKYHQLAVNNGYKDCIIAGFKDGKRMSLDEMRALEGK